MFTWFEGLGATLPPPMTSIFAPVPSLYVSARVSPVALGMGGIGKMRLIAGSKPKELVVSTTKPP